MRVIRLKNLDLSSNRIVEELGDEESDRLIKAYLEAYKFILSSGRSERIRIADLIDLTDAFKETIDKVTLSKIEREISDLKLINGNYYKTVQFD